MRNRSERHRGPEHHRGAHDGFNRREDMGGAEWSGASGRGGREHQPDGAGRVYSRGEDMGGSGWSGASGRGGMGYRESWQERAHEPNGRHSQAPHESGHHARRPVSYEHDFSGRGFGVSDFGDPPPHDHGYDQGHQHHGRQDHGRQDHGRQDYGRQDHGHRTFADHVLLDRQRSEPPPRGPHWGKGPKGYKRSDERIREDVCDAIANQGEIDATDVDVLVEGSVVTLRGTVCERHHKRALEQLVERCRGVEDVQNDLRLARAAAADRPPQEPPNGVRN